MGKPPYISVKYNRRYTKSFRQFVQTYIHRESYHLPSIIKQLPLPVESRLSKLSSDENVFIQAASVYQEPDTIINLSYNNSDEYNTNNNNNKDNFNNNATKNDNNFNNKKFKFNHNDHWDNNDNNNNEKNFNSYQNKASDDNNNNNFKLNSNDNR